MAIDRIESGFATLQYEIVEERASALGRMGRRLEAALAAFSGSDSPDPNYAVPDEVHAQLGLPLTAYPMRRRRSVQAKTS